MSSTIGVCPDCGRIGAHAELPEQTVAALKRALMHSRINPETWSVRAYWCPHCEAVYLTAWSRGIDLAGRRALLAPTNEPLAITEDAESAPPIPEAVLFDSPTEPADQGAAGGAPTSSETSKKPHKGGRRTP